MKIYDRKNSIYIEEKETQAELLRFLYGTITGRLLLKIVAKSGFSKALSLYYKSRLSRRKIVKFVKEFQIDVDEERLSEFGSFNDFFIRERHVRADRRVDALISPAASRLFVCRIKDSARVRIKNTCYSIRDILGERGKHLAPDYEGGLCLVCRLAVTDHHRYLFIDNGTVKSSYRIPGELHTVRSISEDYRVYARNSRVISVLRTEHLGEIIQAEVGALTIGAVVNRRKRRFRRGEEKGYFEYGGSTIVILIKAGRAEIDRDIAEQSRQGIEVWVDAGEKIGRMTGGRQRSGEEKEHAEETAHIS